MLGWCSSVQKYPSVEEEIDFLQKRSSAEENEEISSKKKPGFDSNTTQKELSGKVYTKKYKFETVGTQCSFLKSVVYKSVDGSKLFEENQFMKFYKANDEDDKNWVLKVYSVNKVLFKENLKFYKDFIFSAYFEHKNILSPENVYLEPNKVIVYEDLHNETLEEFLQARINEDKPFEYYEIIEIITHLIEAINYWHDNGIIVNDIWLRNIVFTEPKNISTLKIMNFSQAVLINNKEEFITTVDIVKMPGLNKMEAAILTNKYDEHLQSAQSIEYVNVLYKSPEYLMKKPIGLKSDIWSLGAILHNLILNCHIHEVVLQKYAFDMSKKDVRGMFLDDMDELRNFSFDHKIYGTIPTPLFDILKQTLDSFPENRPSAHNLATMIKRVNLTELFLLSLPRKVAESDDGQNA